MLSTKRINAIVSAMDAATTRRNPVGSKEIFQHVLEHKDGSLFATNTHFLINITNKEVIDKLKSGEYFKKEIFTREMETAHNHIPDINRVIPDDDKLKYTLVVSINELKQLKKEKKFFYGEKNPPAVMIDLTPYNLGKYALNPNYILTVAKALNLSDKVMLEWSGKVLQPCKIKAEFGDGLAVITPIRLNPANTVLPTAITCYACIDNTTGEILEAQQKAAPQMQEETAVEKAIEKTDEDVHNTPEETEAAALINRLETDAARADSFASAAQGRGMTIQVKGMTTLDPIIWITGNTKQHKDWLKAQGAKWCAKKSAWYYHPNRVRAIRAAA